MSGNDLPRGDYCALTPYLVPIGLGKKVNVGDGFIFDSATKLIGVKPTAVFSSRAALTDSDLEVINSTKFLVAFGANTLKDNFELAPGFDLRLLQRIRVPVVLMGIGHYGVPEVTRGLMPSSVDLLTAILERFPHLSVRCDASRQYLVSALNKPGQQDRVLMTSCPVVYPVDGINKGFFRKAEYETLVVTVTDRSDWRGQAPIVSVAHQLFKARDRYLAVHQDFGNEGLYQYAESLGFKVFRSPNYGDFLNLYASADIHFGNRLHAHLKSLSNGVVSFLTPFDLRQVFFSESLDFPLIMHVPSEHLFTYNFDKFLMRRNAANDAMQLFVAALRSLL